MKQKAAICARGANFAFVPTVLHGNGLVPIVLSAGLELIHELNEPSISNVRPGSARTGDGLGQRTTDVRYSVGSQEAGEKVAGCPRLRRSKARFIMNRSLVPLAKRSLGVILIGAIIGAVVEFGGTNRIDRATIQGV